MQTNGGLLHQNQTHRAAGCVSECRHGTDGSHFQRIFDDRPGLLTLSCLSLSLSLTAVVRRVKDFFSLPDSHTITQLAVNRPHAVCSSHHPSVLWHMFPHCCITSSQSSLPIGLVHRYVGVILKWSCLQSATLAGNENAVWLLWLLSVRAAGE